jgi:hypothetical protein
MPPNSYPIGADNATRTQTVPAKRQNPQPLYNQVRAKSMARCATDEVLSDLKHQMQLLSRTIDTSIFDTIASKLTTFLEQKLDSILEDMAETMEQALATQHRNNLAFQHSLLLTNQAFQANLVSTIMTLQQNAVNSIDKA